MYCHRQHRTRNYLIILVMFSAFPNLLWHAFGNISGFFVGVLVTFILTVMLNNLLRQNAVSTTISTSQRSSQVVEQRPLHQQEQEELEPYQRGYRAEPDREEQPLPQAWESKSQYEEIQVTYPQEMPPMEQQ